LAVLNQAHIPYVAGFMELVVVVALLSAFNANIYGTSRMAYSLSRRGDGPAFMARISNSGVPLNAVLLSVFFGFVSVLLNWWLPDDLLGLLLNAVGSALLVIWIFIVVSHLRLRPRLEREGKLTVRMWLFPWLSYVTLAMLAGFVVLMLFDSDARTQLISTCVLFLAIAALGVLNTRLRKRSQTV
jgi:aromatic amino acid permease